jgi:hypothetical protein
MKNLIFLDFETTGLSSKALVHQAGVIHYGYEGEFNRKTLPKLIFRKEVVADFAIFDFDKKFMEGHEYSPKAMEMFFKHKKVENSGHVTYDKFALDTLFNKCFTLPKDHPDYYVEKVWKFNTSNVMWVIKNPRFDLQYFTEKQLFENLGIRYDYANVFCVANLACLQNLNTKYGLEDLYNYYSKIEPLILRSKNDLTSHTGLGDVRMMEEIFFKCQTFIKFE